ncbi:hypothetical protein RFI_19845, partial [Reticulomyxa filosa]
TLTCKKKKKLSTMTKMTCAKKKKNNNNNTRTQLSKREQVEIQGTLSGSAHWFELAKFASLAVRTRNGSGADLERRNDKSEKGRGSPDLIEFELYLKRFLFLSNPVHVNISVVKYRVPILEREGTNTAGATYIPPLCEEDKHESRPDEGFAVMQKSAFPLFYFDIPTSDLVHTYQFNNVILVNFQFH